VPVTILDRHVATVPLYELTKDVEVKNVNMRAGHDIDLVEAHVRYRVNDPARALIGIPNRGRIQNEIARGMGMPLARAQMDPAFWEKLLAAQMEAEVDDILRAVLFRVPPAPAAHTLLDRDGTPMDEKVGKAARGTGLEAYLDRMRLSREVLLELKALVSRWGVTVTHLDLDFYKLKEDIMKGVRSGGQAGELERERKKKDAATDAEVYYIRETAGAEAEAEAERVRKLVQVLQDELGRDDLPRAVLEEIIVTAIRATGNAPLLSAEYPQLFEENRSEKPSGGGSGTNGARK
jgi:hypothetical protein